ncbi:MAG TPA: polyphosphate kinase 1 [Saprospiraceae bacterium]|nr:polyphosphate kinase 1 [Saprospiraceae bacterium]
MSQLEINLDNKEVPFVDRDLSWLAFNYRVLQEAKDPTNPLLERLKFLAIYSSNLDEFFRVRVAHHRNLLQVGKKTKRQLHEQPKQILRQIQTIVSEHQEEFSDIFTHQIIPHLAKHGIHVLRRGALAEDQIQFIEQFFQDNLLPYVQPVLLVKGMIRPFLNNATIYLCVDLRDKAHPEDPSAYALVQVPSSHLGRFIELPSNRGEHDIIMLDDIVRHNITWLFPGYNIINSYSIKLTRDAELYIDDEYSGDLLVKIRHSLAKRNVGPASRLVYDKEMPEEMLTFMTEILEVSDFGLFPEGRYHNNFDFFGFPDFGKQALKDSQLKPLAYFPLERSEDFFDAIRQQDHLINVPYHSYESVVQFFERAARDPAVTHIKIITYRVARDSRIMDALMAGVKSGKQVAAFVEVKARFDEEANLKWGERLEQSGVQVKYSFPGLKVHSKAALVRRVEKGGEQLYVYLGTGNFHEKTAKLYSDFGIFSADHRLTSEVARLFSFLETVRVPTHGFEHLLVGQFNLRRQLEEYIDFEIEQARAGKPAKIFLKINSLQDMTMIEKLYRASQVGVEIQMIIRGICCLVPGMDGISENITAISILDRFLEHARVFIFHHGGEEKTYLSSADWMERNLSFRIETTFPVYDARIKRLIHEIMRIQWRDNVKARHIHFENNNTYRKTSQDLSIRSQEETYYFLKRLNEQWLQQSSDGGTPTGISRAVEH